MSAPTTRMAVSAGDASSSAAGIDRSARAAGGDELRLASRELADGLLRTELSVPAMHCAGCIRTVERSLAGLPGVEHARVNLSTRRVAVHWRSETSTPPMLETLETAGYPAHLFEPAPADEDKELKRLLRALAVAGFCAMNIMLFSVSIWAGADAPTRNLFHWISAALALPALLYSGRIFFIPAWNAARRGRANMDVPISVGVLLAFGLSLFDTMEGGALAYFDASVTLLFFLLVGRTLDYVMRTRARTAVSGLARLAGRGATVIKPDGGTVYLPVGDLEPDMKFILAAGERAPVDAAVESGVSDVDCAIVSGESTPVRAANGDVLRAGTLNLTGPLRLRVLAGADTSFLAEMVRLMEVAEGGRARYRRIADRVSQLYAPVVHLTALATFLGWMLATGDWHRAISIGIAVLIITCPCALGLAVPMVQVMAARRLFDFGIMVKDGTALERLAEIDSVVFDKTGTLTRGRPRLVDCDDIAPEHLAIAAAMAAHSRHPLSRCLAAFRDADWAGRFGSIRECAGEGIEAVEGASVYRLGRAGWALAEGRTDGSGRGTVLARDGQLLASFQFDDQLREGAEATVAELRRRSLGVVLLSGDAPEAVSALADRLGISEHAAGVAPVEKLARIEGLERAGHRVLMVGDGLNDAPALAGAHVSMAPAEAADIGRNAADFVFMRRSLEAVLVAHDTALVSGRLIRQNIGLAVAYNAIAVPIAVLGYVTPLIAAVAMSLSSLLVVANALRLGVTRKHGRPTAAFPAARTAG